MRFSDSKKHRTIKIIGSNKLSVLRDGDTVLMEQWLDARGFIIKRGADEEEPEEFRRAFQRPRAGPLWPTDRGT